MDEYLSKPLDSSKLTSVLDAMLEAADACQRPSRRGGANCRRGASKRWAARNGLHVCFGSARTIEWPRCPRARTVPVLGSTEAC